MKSPSSSGAIQFPRAAGFRNLPRAVFSCREVFPYHAGVNGQLNKFVPGARCGRVIIATLIWLAAAFSLGWYYTFTYYGRAGWPIPMPEPCAALVLYYFSVLNVDTELQAVHWLLVFPLAGLLWSFSLNEAGRRLKMTPPDWTVTFRDLSLSAIPLALPGPWMACIAGLRDDQFTWQRMVAVALRRGHVEPWYWLSPLYLALGLAGFAIQIVLYRKLFAGTARQRWIHYPVAAIVLVVMSSVLAALVAIPLRLWLE